MELLICTSAPKRHSVASSGNICRALSLNIHYVSLLSRKVSNTALEKSRCPKYITMKRC